jgi:hypothetical protein
LKQPIFLGDRKIGKVNQGNAFHFTAQQKGQHKCAALQN